METINDIIAELREYEDSPPPRHAWLHIADRIEQAVTNCNQLKLCEALEEFVEYSELVQQMGIFVRDSLIKITTKARAALTEPPRNCDVYTTEVEASKAFIVWYNTVYGLNGDKYEVESCDLKHNVDDILHDYIKWLFAEAKGDAK